MQRENPDEHRDLTSQSRRAPFGVRQKMACVRHYGQGTVVRVYFWSESSVQTQVSTCMLHRGVAYSVQYCTREVLEVSIGVVDE